MKRIEVDAKSIRIVGGPDPAPPTSGIGATLRRYRFRAALVLAAAELIAFVTASRPATVVLLLVAILAIVVHFGLSRRHAPYPVRQVTWVLAFAQALVALFPVLVGVTMLAVVVTLVGGVLIGIMLMLGDR